MAPSDSPSGTEAFADRVLGSVLGWMETMSIHIGIELGWYRALASGPQTAPSLADATGTDPRYAREWLEQQTAIGILDVDDAGAAPDLRRFALPAERAEVLLDERSLAYTGPLATMLAASAARMPEIVDAYRVGGGVSWERLGLLARTAQAAANKPWFHEMPKTLTEIGWLHERLGRPGARVADVGMGGGWSSIALADAYPALEVVGVDIDVASVEMARRNASDVGLGDRVTFVAEDAARLAERGPFDVIFAFECVHDMPDPVEVLGAMRDALAPGGSVVIMDEAVNETFTPAAGDLERLMYGYSLFVCLPDGMSHPGSAATGTVMRPSVLSGYARAAGFGDAEIIAPEFGFWRLYRLRDASDASEAASA